MADIRYFADHKGQTIRFDRVDHRGGREGVWGWHAAEQIWVRCDRKVEFKSNPSRHACDDRCLNAQGRVMRCECSCGGKNHGKGAGLICEAA